ncbi:MAG: hypothetical protein AB7U85_02615 [Alphaproteobacteria bacterium]
MTSYAEIEKELSMIVKSQLVKEDDAVRQMFADEYGKKRKTLLGAICLWFICCHRFYVDRISMQFLQWVLFAVFIGIIWWIVDLFLLSSLVKTKNDIISKNILAEHKMLRN